MEPSSSGLICNQVQSQTATVCFTGSGPEGLGGRCLEHTMGELGSVRLSTRGSAPSSDLQIERSGLSQNDPGGSRMAKHALVLGPSELVGLNPLQTPSGSRSGDSALQRASPQES